MTLKEYLDTHGIRYAQMAEIIGAANAKVVHRHATGEQIPSKEFMARYFSATDGMVTPNDFYDLPTANVALRTIAPAPVTP